MSIQLMNHEEAVNGLATERYLLGEMQEEERSAFEQHYLDCAHCLEAVTFAGEFMDGAKPVAREMQPAETSDRARGRERRIFLSGLLAAVRSPAPAFALVLLLFLGGLSTYQATLIHNQKEMLAQAMAPAQEFRFAITGQSRSGERAISLRRGARLSLVVEFMPEQELTTYRADILSASNLLKYSVPLTVNSSDDSVAVSVPAGVLEPGNYSVVIRGQSPGGNQKDLATSTFELRFID